MIVIISMCTNISAHMEVKVTLDGNEVYFPERYHRLGEVLVMLNMADVKIFHDEKTLMKKTHGFTRADETDLSDYCVEKTQRNFIRLQN